MPLNITKFYPFCFNYKGSHLYLTDKLEWEIRSGTGKPAKPCTDTVAMDLIRKIGREYVKDYQKQKSADG